MRQSEARFRTLSDAVPPVNWSNNEDGIADYFNKRWYEFTGLSFKQSEGLGWQAVVHPADAPATVEKWDRSIVAGKIFVTEYRLRRYDGSYYWFIGRNVPLKNDRGEVTAWFGMATDIVAIKLAEEALIQSEARLNITMKYATVYAIITMNSTAIVEPLSQGATLLYDYSEEEIKGQSFEVIFTQEDREAGVPLKNMESAKLNCRAIDKRWQKRKDGSRFFVSGVLRPIQNGDIKGYVKITRDMTQQQLIREELHG